MAEGLETFFKVVLLRVFLGLSNRYGFWVALVLTLAFLGALWLAVLTIGLLIREVVALLARMTKVVPPGVAVPPFFGVSYTDLATNSRVCHVIPISFIVGLAQVSRLRLKKGLGVKLGGKRA